MTQKEQIKHLMEELHKKDEKIRQLKIEVEQQQELLDFFYWEINKRHFPDHSYSSSSKKWDHDFDCIQMMKDADAAVRKHRFGTNSAKAKEHEALFKPYYDRIDQASSTKERNLRLTEKAIFHARYWAEEYKDSNPEESQWWESVELQKLAELQQYQ